MRKEELLEPENRGVITGKEHSESLIYKGVTHNTEGTGWGKTVGEKKLLGKNRGRRMVK